MEIAIYADINNIYSALQSKYKRKLDYQKYMDFIKPMGKIVTAHAYGTCIGHEARAFIAHLRRAGFKTHFKDPKKGTWDVQMTLDLMQCKADLAVLGSSSLLTTPVLDAVTCKTLIFACNIASNHKTIEIPESLLE